MVTLSKILDGKSGVSEVFARQVLPFEISLAIINSLQDMHVSGCSGCSRFGIV
ncbi:MAG: hypothetical protein HON65_09930 [Rhodospirillales bacterium]|nr:hypothetical protein [Rhodospirillales bacterium]